MTTRTEVATVDGRRATTARVGAFEVSRLEFPQNFAHGEIEPDRGYVVVVLEGVVCKTFPADVATLSRDSVATLPAGAKHSSTFAPNGAKVLAVRAAEPEPSPLFGSLLARRRHARAAGSTALAWRMASELEARDACWCLALEGLVLQLLATAERAAGDDSARPYRWLGRARDLLHERAPDHLSLGELAEAVGVHPTHLARAFRREYGLTVAQYARSLRLEWAAAQLSLTDAPLAHVALEAGFADQSHFTRAFRLHAGVTPGRYRALVRR